MRKLGEYARGRNNNFNLMRFIAASLVLYSHSFPLTTGDPYSEPLWAQLSLTWGMIAVDIFFITSGFLVCGSFFARSDIKAFIWARVLRIVPALIVISVLTVCGLGVQFTSLPLSDYFAEDKTWKYLIKNIVLFFGVEYSLPGVFADLPYPNAINGSLWTLPIEVEMYTQLALLGLLLRWLQPRLSCSWLTPTVFAALAIGALIANFVQFFSDVESGPGLRLFYMFFVGSTCYIFRDRLLISNALAGIAVAILVVALLNGKAFHLAYYVVVPYLVFWLAYVPGGAIRQFNRLGDYSYGIYIYAFPVQQTISALLPGVTVNVMFSYASTFTLLFAVLSWHLVEKRALLLKGRFVGAGPNSSRK